MRNDKIEMRIEQDKKEQLAQIANEMGLKVSEILYLLIEKCLSDNQFVISEVNKNCRIATYMMNINDLVSQVEGELHDRLLEEIGELECLL